MIKKNLKMVIEWPGYGACGLSIESLSVVDWLGGCGANCGNDVPFKFRPSHYCSRYVLYMATATLECSRFRVWNAVALSSGLPHGHTH